MKSIKMLAVLAVAIYVLVPMVLVGLRDYIQYIAWVLRVTK